MCFMPLLVLNCILYINDLTTRDKPWLEHTFDPQQIRGLTVFDPGTFWPEPKIFFWPNGKKVETLGFLGEIFKIQTSTKDGWPDPRNKNLTRSDPTRVKITTSSYQQRFHDLGIYYNYSQSRIFSSNYLSLLG